MNRDESEHDTLVLRRSRDSIRPVTVRRRVSERGSTVRVLTKASYGVNRDAARVTLRTVLNRMGAEMRGATTRCASE